jgi:D-alanyl-D-alanine carboxypeptidase
MRINRRNVLAGSAAMSGLLLTGCGMNHRVTSNWLTQRIAGIPEAHNIPGMTAGIALPGGNVVTAATGLADLETGEAMRPDHVMQAGSTGKTFVAASATDLVLSGDLDLDAPIGTWLADTPWFDDLAHRDAITPRLLLTHRSGLVEYLGQPEFTPLHAARIATDPDRPIRTDESLPIAVAAGPLFAPGEGFSYADTNYLLIGLIIEAISGRTYEAQVTSRILEPNGLIGGILPATQRAIPDLAPSYLAQPIFGLPEKCSENGVLAMHPLTEWTGGGMATRAGDLARWGWLWFGGRALSGAYDMIAEAERGSGVIEADGADWRYGMACEIRLSPGPRLIGHRGWFPAFQSVLAYKPSLDMAVALQFNRVPSVPDMYGLAESILDEAAAL